MAKVLLIGGDGGRSGVPRHLQHLLKGCDGLARFVLLSERDRGGYAFLRRSDVRHITVNGLATRSGPLRMLRTARLLARLIRREDPRLVWVHARMAVLLVHLLAIAGVFCRPGPALAVTYHGLPFDPGHWRLAAAFALRLERLSLRHGPARCLIFLSATARDDYLATVGPGTCARHRLVVLGNTSDIGPLPDPLPRDGTRRILVTGRLARQKNLERALRLFAALPGTYLMTFCGEGTDSYRFRRQARRILGAHALQRIDFAGAVDDLRPHLLMADCYLLTSRYEGQPIAALEAFEAGLPMALPDIPGCRQLLATHPEAAVLTPLASEDPVEDALRVVALAEAHGRDPVGCRALCRSAWARHFDFADWSERMQDLLRSLLPEAPAPFAACPVAPPGPGKVVPEARQVLPFVPRKGPPPGARPRAGG
ncbi:MAG: glycosyltransferase family 4 protein [Rhodobacteraceae bacterium]|nr:glycosyltransferase family 4 protein [Paracoccaceae bacterium]MBR9822806.1 glycosyltransferase family 4 protein [Paracoccaceae bacterium]